MIGPTADELERLVEAEQEGVRAGWLLPCRHQSLLQRPCVRSDGHQPPHALDFGVEPPPTSPEPADRPL